jgi:hypothetical protein
MMNTYSAGGYMQLKDDSSVNNIQHTIEACNGQPEIIKSFKTKERQILIIFSAAVSSHLDSIKFIHCFQKQAKAEFGKSLTKLHIATTHSSSN